MQLNFEKIWREWRGFVVFIAVMLIFRSAIADWNQVPSGSMVPSIYIGDRIVVDKLAYDLRVPFTQVSIIRWGQPMRGDVVTFPSPADEKLLVKRVVGIPGDVVELIDNELHINGAIAHYEPLPPDLVSAVPLDDPLRYRLLKESILGNERLVMLHSSTYRSVASNFGPVEVPAEHYLVMGDNRDNSRDSRFIGFISRDRILGRAETVAFSLDYENYYQPRLDRFFTSLP